MKNINIYFCLLFVLLFTGCGNKNENTVKDSRSSKTFKLKIEITCDNKDIDKIYLKNPAYFFAGKQGKGETYYFRGGNKTEQVRIPYKEEFDIPKNFVGFAFEANCNYSIYEGSNNDLNVKIYVNNKLFLSESCKSLFMCSIDYDLESKKYKLEYVNKFSDIFDINKKVFDKLY